MSLAFCPFHEHSYRSPSLHINVEKKVFNCFSCGEKGHINKILKHFGISMFDNIKSHEQFVDKLQSLLLFKDEEIAQEEYQLPDVSELKQFRYLHPYLLKRGFSREILIQNQVGFDKQACAATIPVFHNDTYYGVIRRTVLSDVLPKYTYPPGFPKQRLLYSPKVISVREADVKLYGEGSLDALNGADKGYYTDAILGARFSDSQIQEFEREPRRKFLALDNDPAGRAGIQDILRKTTLWDIWIFNFPEGKKDLGELTADEISWGVANAKHRFDFDL
jgi:DNA primase